MPAPFAPSNSFLTSSPCTFTSILYIKCAGDVALDSESWTKVLIPAGQVVVIRSQLRTGTRALGSLPVHSFSRPLVLTMRSAAFGVSSRGALPAGLPFHRRRGERCGQPASKAPPPH